MRRVVVSAARAIDGDSSEEARRAIMAVARGMALPLADAKALFEFLPVALPKRLSESEADTLVAALAAAGARATSEAVHVATRLACSTHAALDGAESCEGCGALVCSLCFARAGGRWKCAACTRKERRKRTFFRVRISVLLTILAGVLLYAWRDVHRRHARNEWTHPLHVALVVLRLGPVDPAAIEAFHARIPALERRLAGEAARYRPDDHSPVDFEMKGPIDVTEPPPVPSGDGTVDLARHAYTRWRYLSRIDEAAGVVSGGFDSIIYVVAKPAGGPRQQGVETKRAGTAPAVQPGQLETGETGSRFAARGIGRDAIRAANRFVLATIARHATGGRRPRRVSFSATS